MKTEAGLLFRQKAVVNGSLAGIVNLVGDARKIRIDAGELEVVVDLVEKIAQGGRIAVAGADQASQAGGQFLLDGFFEHRTAHDGAGGKEPEEVAAGGFVEVAVRFFRTGSGHHKFAQVGGTGNRGLDGVEKFERQRRSEQIVLLRIERVLDLLPRRSLRSIAGLKTGEGREAPAGVVDESLAHVLGDLAPAGDEGPRIGFVPGAEFPIHNAGENVAQLVQAPGPGKLGDRIAELTARCVLR